MLEILKLLIEVVLFVLIVSAVCGLVAFFRDLKRFKGDLNISLPRAKLIEKIIEQQELERQKKAEEAAETSEEKEEEHTEEQKKEGEPNECAVF